MLASAHRSFQAATEKSLKLRDVPVQQASKSDGTEVVPYDRRDVPEEDPSKSDGGNIVPYTRRDVPEQDPSKADNGNIVPYKRSSYIPLELAVRSVDGVVELY